MGLAWQKNVPVVRECECARSHIESGTVQIRASGSGDPVPCPPVPCACPPVPCAIIAVLGKNPDPAKGRNYDIPQEQWIEGISSGRARIVLGPGG